MKAGVMFVAMVLLAACASLGHKSRLSDNISRIENGMSKVRVEKVLGTLGNRIVAKNDEFNNVIEIYEIREPYRDNTGARMQNVYEIVFFNGELHTWKVKRVPAGR